MNQITPPLARRLRSFLHEQNSVARREDAMASLPLLSLPLQIESMREVHRHWTDVVWFLRDLDDACKFRIVRAMETLVLSPSETAPTHRFFVIQNGTVIHGGRLLTRGATFGDDVLLSDESYFSPVSCRSLSYTDTMCIKRHDLFAAVSPFQQSAKLLRRCTVRLALRRAIVLISRDMKNQSLGATGIKSKMLDKLQGALDSKMSQAHKKSMQIALDLESTLASKVDSNRLRQGPDGVERGADDGGRAGGRGGRIYIMADSGGSSEPYYFETRVLSALAELKSAVNIQAVQIARLGGEAQAEEMEAAAWIDQVRAPQVSLGASSSAPGLDRTRRNCSAALARNGQCGLRADRGWGAPARAYADVGLGGARMGEESMEPPSLKNKEGALCAADYASSYASSSHGRALERTPSARRRRSKQPCSCRHRSPHESQAPEDFMLPNQPEIGATEGVQPASRGRSVAGSATLERARSPKDSNGGRAIARLDSILAQAESGRAGSGHGASVQGTAPEQRASTVSPPGGKNLWI